MKAIAIVGVIATHAGPAGPVWAADWTTFDAWARLTWNILAVPAFLMIAGILYRRDRPISGSELGPRLTRIAIPYLVASLVLTTARVEPWASAPILTTISGGPYYFLWLLVECIAITFLLSRSSDGFAWAVLAACVGAIVLIALDPTWLDPLDMFWRGREPLNGFALGFFLLGWLGLPQRLADRVPGGWLAVGALACLAVWITMPHNGTLPRVMYSLFAVAYLLGAKWKFPGMARLSESTLLVYLMQEPILWMLTPAFDAWPPPIRFALLVVVATTIPLAIGTGARAILGSTRARFWLGA